MEYSRRSDKYRSLLENLLEGCQIIGPDWTYLYLNRAVCMHAKKAKAELLGRKMMEVFPGIERTPMFDRLRECMASKVPATMLNEFRYPDGTIGWFQLSMEPVPEGLLILSMDVSSLKNAEARVEKLNRLYRVLSNTNQTIVRLRRDVPAVLREACRICVAAGGLRAAWIALENPSSGELESVAGHGVQGLVADPEKHSRRAEDTSSIIGTVLRGGRPRVCVLGPEDNELGAAGRKAFAAGCRSCAFFPIATPDEAARGVIGLFASEPGFFDVEELELIAEMAMDLGLALEMEEAEAQRRHAEAELLESEEKYRILFEGSSEGILVADEETRLFSYANPAACRMLGYSARELTTLKVVDIHPVSALEQVGEAFQDYIRGEKSFAESVPCRRKDDSLLYADVSTARLLIAGRNCTVGFFTDVTERRSLRQQLYQSQKLEAIGRLAGGLAHDFNNILSAVTGYCELMKAQLKGEDPLRRGVEQILKYSDKAASLTRQLLAYSRRQALEPHVLDLNAVVADLESMLRRLIGESIGLCVRTAAEPMPVKADVSQLEQVIVNLSVNARDAMPQGGSLTIESDAVLVDEAFSRLHLDAAPGRYVVLTVSDTGLGMDEITKSRIFEPFFTTKEKAKGTGLGLSTVYGIVKQSGGFILIDSKPGRGSTFKIHLAYVEGEPIAGAVATPESADSGGNETILVVEDEEAIREILCGMLRLAGYRIIPAADGEAALLAARNHPEPIHLLITDMMLPGTNGRKLSESLAGMRPGLKVVYISGYADDAVDAGEFPGPGSHFLEKPFHLNTLKAKVREVLDEGPRHRARAALPGGTSS